MGEGIEAVWAEIVDKFEVSNQDERRDEEIGATVIGFEAEGRIFAVSVSDDFDRDCDPDQDDLSRLETVLRSSKDGKATVRKSGVYAT